MKAKNQRLRYMAAAGMTAALYTVLSLVNIPISFFQFRPAEALTALPLLTPAAIPGLFLGCMIANYMTGCLFYDILFGSIATLLGAIGTRVLRKRPALAMLPPVLSNTLIIPPILVFAYGANDAYPLLMLSVFVGELISCYLLGLIFHRAAKHFSHIR